MNELVFNSGVFFESQDLATISQSSIELPDRDFLYGRLLIFTCFALRTFSNLGRCDTANNLAQCLEMTTEKHLLALASTNSFGSTKFAVKYEAPARYEKSFTCQLHASISNGIPNLKFEYDYSGFGLLGRGLGYYAPISVIGLLWDNANLITDLPNVAAAWAAATSGISKLYSAGKITFDNQRELSLAVATKCAQDFAPDEWLRALP